MKAEELAKKLEIVSNMIHMGEKISCGQETALMDQAAALIRKQAKALEEIATNHANGATFSGTDCAEIAREALGDE